jgi:hypothetical protein
MTIPVVYFHRQRLKRIVFIHGSHAEGNQSPYRIKINQDPNVEVYTGAEAVVCH